MPPTVAAPLHDFELVRRAAARGSDRERRHASHAFQTLFERHSPALLAYFAARAPREVIERLAELVWRRAWAKIGIDAAKHFRGWLLQFARSALLEPRRELRPGEAPSHLTSERAWRSSSFYGIEEGSTGVGRRRLMEAICELELDAIEVVRARLRGESFETLAARLGTSADRARRWWRESRERLAEIAADSGAPTFVAMDLPEADEEIAAWLESVFVGVRLRELVAELQAINPPAGDDPPLAAIIGPYAAPLYDRGLVALPPASIETMLARPRLLESVQEWVLLRGGEHWDHALSASPELVELEGAFLASFSPPWERGPEPRSWSFSSVVVPARPSAPPAPTPERVARPNPPREAATIAPSAPPAPRTSPTSAAEPKRPPAPAKADRPAASPPTPPTPTRRSWKRDAFVAALGAAAVLAAWERFSDDGPLAVWERLRAGAPRAAASRGWDEPSRRPAGGVDRSADSPEAYLADVAGSVERWLVAPTPDAESMAARIADARGALSRLILVERDSLAKADRDWLVERCRAAASELDRALIVLEAGAAPEEVRAALLEIAGRLSDDLRSRATKLRDASST